jgi:hypothetical protein
VPAPAAVRGTDQRVRVRQGGHPPYRLGGDPGQVHQQHHHRDGVGVGQRGEPGAQGTAQPGRPGVIDHDGRVTEVGPGAHPLGAGTEHHDDGRASGVAQHVGRQVHEEPVAPAQQRLRRADTTPTTGREEQPRNPVHRATPHPATVRSAPPRAR